MNYSFTDYLNNRFYDEIMEAAEECLCADNVRGLSARVTAVQIWQISTDVLLKYEDYAKFPVVISARVCTDEDGSTFCRNVYMRGFLSGTISQYFDDFEISLTEILRHTPKRTLQKFSDDLLPRLTEDEMEEQANRLLFKVYKYTHTETRPQKISPAFIANTLGIRIYFARLSKDGDVRGAYIFSDTTIKLYDDSPAGYHFSKISGKSILIDVSLRCNMEAVRFTVMHELIHAYVQRFAFYLIAMCNQEFCKFHCPIRLYDDYQFADHFLERAERQADAIASYALMPKKNFRMKADEILSAYGALPCSGCIREAVEKLAGFFGVSITAAKRRMLEIGIEEAKGVYNYIDGAYVPPFAFRKGSLKQHETFVISLRQLQKIVGTNKKLQKHIMRDRVRFVENHLVLNTPDFIAGYGKDMCLTDYAREHLHECAFKFRLVFPNTSLTPERNGQNENIIFRSAVADSPVSLIYSDDNTSLEEKIKMIHERNKGVQEVLNRMNGSHPEMFTALIEWSDMKVDEIAYESWVSDRTIRNLKSDEESSPGKVTLIQLCIGMSLPMEVSWKLLTAFGFGAAYTEKEMIYMQLLMFAYKYTIEECNAILTGVGYPPLARSNPMLH